MDQPTSGAPTQQPGQPNNTPKIMGGVIVLLILLGIGWFAVSKKGSNTEVKSGTETAGTMQKEQTNASPMSLKDLMTGGKTQTCVFNTSSQSGTTEGKVYMADGKMRADSSVNSNGKTMGAHMINDGKYMYSWSDEQKMGAKFSIDEMQKMQNDMKAPQGETSASRPAVDENAKYSYNCSSWSADESMFTPPSDVNFVDPSAMMNQMKIPTAGAGTSIGTGNNASACLACDQAGPNKAQCLAALHCN